jgi:hypothetical protein
LIAAVVSEAHPDPTHRRGLGSEERLAAVVLETHQRRGVEIDQVGVDDDVADESLLTGFCLHVDQADAREALALRGLVVVAQELVAAAHREHHRACFDRAL